MRPRRLIPPEIRAVREAKRAYVRAPHGKRLARLAALRQAKHIALKARV
jgi:hypothetical protein